MRERLSIAKLSAKQRSDYIILARLKTPSTFTKLLESTGFSKSTLTIHLRELRKKGKIEKVLMGDDVVYQLTSSAKEDKRMAELLEKSALVASIEDALREAGMYVGMPAICPRVTPRSRYFQLLKQHEPGTPPIGIPHTIVKEITTGTQKILGKRCGDFLNSWLRDVFAVAYQTGILDRKYVSREGKFKTSEFERISNEEIEKIEKSLFAPHQKLFFIEEIDTNRLFGWLKSPIGKKVLPLVLREQTVKLEKQMKRR